MISGMKWPREAEVLAIYYRVPGMEPRAESECGFSYLPLRKGYTELRVELKTEPQGQDRYSPRWGRRVFGFGDF